MRAFSYFCMNFRDRLFLPVFQPFLEQIMRKRFIEKMSLRQPAAVLNQKLCLIFCLNALGNNIHTKVVYRDRYY